MAKRLVASILLGSMLLLQAHPVLAQAAQQAQETQSTSPAPAAKADVNECIEQGKSAGQHTATGGAFGIGLASGLLLGLIGTAIAYAAQGEPEPSVMSKYQTMDPTCRMAYADAFGDMGKKKKRSAALTGGLLGTAVLVVAVLASGGE